MSSRDYVLDFDDLRRIGIRETAKAAVAIDEQEYFFEIGRSAAYRLGFSTGYWRGSFDSFWRFGAEFVEDCGSPIDGPYGVISCKPRIVGLRLPGPSSGPVPATAADVARIEEIQRWMNVEIEKIRADRAARTANPDGARRAAEGGGA